MAQKVLVVDGDTNLHPLLHVLLSRAGYAIDFAADGSAGLEKIRSMIYDAILLDLMLPSLSGLDLLATLAHDQPGVVPHVIVLSSATRAKLDEAKGYAVHAVMRKPFDIQELVRTVDSCVVGVCV